MGVDIATWCLEGEASSYLGDINEEELPTDLEELSFLLQHRFGKSFNARLDEFEALRQCQDQSVRKYADVVRRKAYGTHKSETEIIRKFLKTLWDRSTYTYLASHNY